MSENITSRKKLVFGLRIRSNDTDNWSETIWYRSRLKRDKEASMNRILVGNRTWSFEELKTIKEIDEITE